MIKQIILLILVTLIPALELRASIPFGMLYGSERFGIQEGALSWPFVVLICMAANIVLGWGVYWVLAPILAWFERFSWFRRWILPIMEHMRQKLKPYVDKYGEMGVAVFIGIPLPGSGVYTGAVGAFLLGLDRRKFAVANVIGVLIAGTVVTAVCLLVQTGMDLPCLKWILKG
ncbi:MAG: small multi-drug export protein [Lentisphaeria bacterium]|nr:small multi-drug export protein [Lentisphaeria bacterium]